ncbi:MAG TPA: tautomerase [Burkholderiaceae bacterium]
MPNILVRLPQGSLNEETKAQLAARIADAATEAEQIPADPLCRSLRWVLIEGIAPGCWTCGGVDMTTKLLPVMLQIHVPAGVIDDPGREAYAAAISSAVKSVFSDEPRRIVISTVFSEVPDGFWGVGDKIWRLDEFARHARYRHLQQQTSK